MLLSRRLFVGLTAAAAAAAGWPASRLLAQEAGLPDGLAALAGPPPRRPPEAQREVKVADADGLAAALAAARPGDHLILKPGSYQGDFRTQASGLPEAPIVVRAERPRAVEIVGGVALAHDHVWLHELKLTLAAFMQVTGDSNCVTCCLIGGRYGLQIIKGGSFNRIGFNRFALEVGDGSDVQVRLLRDDVGRKTVYGNHIYRNHFTAGPANKVPRKQAGSALYINTWRFDEYPDIGTLIEHNYFDHLKRRSAVRVKSNGSIIRYNMVANKRDRVQDDGAVNFLNRYGRRNLWLGNWSHGARGMIAFHSNNQYIGNVCADGATIDVMAGINGNKGEDSNHPPCEDCLFLGNEGPLRVGFQYFNGKNLLPARRNVIEAQQPDDLGVELLADQEDTEVRERATRALPARARQMAPKEVGPEAA